MPNEFDDYFMPHAGTAPVALDGDGLPLSFLHDIRPAIIWADAQVVAHAPRLAHPGEPDQPAARPKRRGRVVDYRESITVADAGPSFVVERLEFSRTELIVWPMDPWDERKLLSDPVIGWVGEGT